MDAAAETVSAIIAAKIISCTPEFLDKITIRCVEEYAQVGLPLNAEAWKQKIFDYAIKLSGTITGEYAVGLAKRGFPAEGHRRYQPGPDASVQADA